MPGSYKSMKAADFRVHEGKACHECRVKPILGKRYFNAGKSKNLCAACCEVMPSADRASCELVSEGIRPAGDDACIEDPTAEELAAEAEQTRKDVAAQAHKAPGFVFLDGLYGSLFPTIEDPIHLNPLRPLDNRGYVVCLHVDSVSATFSPAANGDCDDSLD